MGLLKSLWKSWKLRKISRVLAEGLPPINVSALMAHADKQSKALQDLLDLAESDVACRMIIQRHNADSETLKKVYHVLDSSGAGQWAKGHFVAASTMVFGLPLDYALRHYNSSEYGAQEEMAWRLVEYFENNKMGFVDEQQAAEFA